MSTTITKVETKTFTKQDGKTNVSHTITLSDGITGYLDDKGSDKDLKSGEAITYTAQDKKNKNGGDYKLLTIHRVSGSSAPASSPAPTPGVHLPATTNIAQMKQQNRIEIMKVHFEGLFNGKIEESKMKESVAEWVSYMDGLTDEIFTK